MARGALWPPAPGPISERVHQIWEGGGKVQIRKHALVLGSVLIGLSCSSQEPSDESDVTVPILWRAREVQWLTQGYVVRAWK